MAGHDMGFDLADMDLISYHSYCNINNRSRPKATKPIEISIIIREAIKLLIFIFQQSRISIYKVNFTIEGYFV